MRTLIKGQCLRHQQEQRDCFRIKMLLRTVGIIMKSLGLSLRSHFNLKEFELVHNQIQPGSIFRSCSRYCCSVGKSSHWSLPVRKDLFFKRLWTSCVLLVYQRDSLLLCRHESFYCQSKCGLFPTQSAFSTRFCSSLALYMALNNCFSTTEEYFEC